MLASSRITSYNVCYTKLLRLWKNVGGTKTLLASIDATIAAGDTFKLEITDAAKKVYHNGIEVLSSGDNALTAAGNWGFFIGNFNGTGGHYRTTWHIDDFLAEEPVNVSVTNITENENTAPTSTNDTITTA